MRQVVVVEHHRRLVDGSDKRLGREVQPVIDPPLAEGSRQLDGDRGGRVARAVGHPGDGYHREGHQHRVVGLDHLGASERVAHLAAAGASPLGDQHIDSGVFGFGACAVGEGHLDAGQPRRAAG